MKRLIPSPLRRWLGTQKYNLGLFFQEIQAYWAYWTKSDASQTKVMIFAQGRSGSTLLESLLDSSGKFKSNGELLSTSNAAYGKRLWSPRKYLEGRAKLSGNQLFIGHVKIYHLSHHKHQEIDPKAFMESLDDSWKIIYLYRENVVRQALSNILAEQGNGYDTVTQKQYRDKIVVDREVFISNAQGRLDYQELEKQVLAEVPHLTVRYESDLLPAERQQATVNRIMDYLKLDHFQANTRYQKVNKKSNEELIENYSEFLEVVKEQNWGHYLEASLMKK